MKIALYSLTFLLLSFSVQAQDSPKTLISLHDLRFSGCGGPSIHGTLVNGERGVLVGGYGGVMLNQTIILGGGGWGLVNNIKADEAVQVLNPGNTQYIRFGYGGFYMEYVHNPLDLFHFSASTLIGGGGVVYSHDMKEPDERDGNPFFVIEPSLNAEVNVTDFLRTNIGVSYRWVNGLDMPHLTNADLSQVSVNLNFKFGWFGPGSYAGSVHEDDED